MKKPFVALILRSLFALLLACTFVRAEDAPLLQKLKHIIVSPTSEQVILQLNGSYSPKVFTLKDENPRIVFDFDGMSCNKDVKVLTTTNGSIVKRIRVGIHEGKPPKTRIVFDVATLNGLNYTQKFDEANSALVIQFTGSAVSPQPQDKEPAPAPTEVIAAVPAATKERPAAASVQPEQAVVPLPFPAQDEQAKVTAQPERPDPFQQPPQPASAPVEETAVATTKQPMPEKTESRETSPPPETADVPGMVKSEEPEKPVKKAATQPAPDSTKEKKDKVAQAQKTSSQPEAAAPPAPPAAAAKKAGEAAPDAGKSETPEKPALLSTVTGKPQIEYIKFDDSSPKGEMVMFKLNGFHPPAIRGVEEGIPRVICDFNNTKLLQTIKGPIKTNGKFVKAIRATTTKKPEKVQVVIDLEPNKSYDLQQVFFKEDNLFVLIVNTVKR